MITKLSTSAMHAYFLISESNEKYKVSRAIIEMLLYLIGAKVFLETMITKPSTSTMFSVFYMLTFKGGNQMRNPKSA